MVVIGHDQTFAQSQLPFTPLFFNCISFISQIACILAFFRFSHLLQCFLKRFFSFSDCIATAQLSRLLASLQL